MPKEIDELDDLFLSARALISKKEYQAAIPKLLELYDKNPQDLECLTHLMICYRITEDYFNALYFSKLAFKLDSHNLSVLSCLGDLYSAIFPLYEFAIPLLKEVVAKETSDFKIYFDLGISFSALDKYDEAIDAFKQALKLSPELSPNEWLTLLWLGIVYLHNNNKEEADKIAKKLHSIDPALSQRLERALSNNELLEDLPENPEQKAEAKEHLQNAGSLITKGEISNGVKELLSAIEKDDKYAVAYTFLGKVLDDHGLFDEGISLHRQAIKLDPSSAVAYNNLGYALGAKGNLEEGIINLKMAIELDPNYVASYNNLGGFYDYLGDYRKGIEQFEKALQLDPDRFITLTNLGYAHKAMGNLNDALMYYRKADKLYPRDPVPKLSIGRLYKEMGMFLEAEKEYLGVLEIEENCLNAWLNLAKCYIGLDDKEKLKKCLYMISKIPPSSPSELIEMAEIMERIDKDKAIECWNNLLSLSEKIPQDPNDLAKAKFHLAKLKAQTN